MEDLEFFVTEKYASEIDLICFGVALWLVVLMRVVIPRKQNLCWLYHLWLRQMGQSVQEWIN